MRRPSFYRRRDLRVLLDSNVLLWSIFDSGRLTSRVAHLLMDESNDLMVSHVTFWELSIKIALGKLPITGTSIQYLLDQTESFGATLLPLTTDHILRSGNLPHYHRDPFDRMLVAQALTEGVPLLTSDRMLSAYGVETIWT